ncbi:putative deoxyribonuclease TATDN3-like protein, partial [Hesseltinella vesiculosa]
MIDVHAHITESNFSDLERLLADAKDAKVQHIISVSESIHDSASVLRIAQQSNGMIWPALGLHPVQSCPDGSYRSVIWDDWIAFKPMLQRAIDTKAIVCVGEVGLDFSYHVLDKDANIQEEQRKIQRMIFKEQIEMAIQAGLPLNVHSRSAGHHALKVLKECDAKLVNMHAFDGKASHVKVGLEAGYYFSIPPSMVRLEQQEKLAKLVPMHQLLLESDAPALAPVKGETNEPKNIIFAARGVASVKGISVEEVISITVGNTLSLFQHRPSTD